METDRQQFLPPSDFEFNSLAEAQNYRSALIDEFKPWLFGNVLEVGSGIGQMTEYLREIQLINLLQCVEPDSRFCGQFRHKFPGQHLIQGTAKDLQSFDWNAIVSINVLEHIADDEDELVRYHRLLKAKNGTLNIFVPARPEIYADLDKEFGHYRRYRKADLRHKLEGAGFRVESMSYFNFIGYFAWYINFCLFRQKTFNPLAVRLFDRIVFPPMHFVESVFFRPPVGQSIIAIARAL